ncbi:MAG: tRNA preQ1(34) S-adenosylmethionine ribosyltransferase-isomerase QueA [Eubacteriales bacterium]|nr:tRNA preQ1(34) S-adenosylmethionine ribosyltransferase-isomerase QueA [Eubacteriales bacterium]
MSETLSTHDFYYDLPPELIAQTPAEPRDSSRLLCYNKATGEIEHKHFYDIIDYLKKGDLLVINNTRVIPARLFGKKDGKDTVFEVFLLKREDYTKWQVLVRPARKLKIGEELKISDELSLKVLGILDDGVREVEFSFNGVFEDILSRVGNMPLPPYIKETLKDKERYQTVYSKIDGSAAAPTAGLHFTPELMKMLEDKGVEFATVLLHIGLGTFRPVKCDNILEHKMHTEEYEIDSLNAEKINKAKREGRRIICVGTTSVRTLESVADENGFVTPKKGATDIFIYPGYKFKAVDALITNFHLPESTLIMLVSAFCGREETMRVYKTAVENKYRFFSFGDSSFFY